MSYERTNKRIDANKISQILTKLCFLFRWVIFNWISSSLHFPAHPLKQHHLPQSGSFVISQSAKGNSEPENFVLQELSVYSAFWWWGWTQAILGGDVCQAGQGGLDGSHFSSWSTECLPSSMSCQLTLVSPPSKLTVFVCWLQAFFFWSARVYGFWFGSSWLVTDQCPITSEPMGGGRRVVGTVGNARGGYVKNIK